MTAPERIWAKTYFGRETEGFWDKEPIASNQPKNRGTKYIRADIATAEADARVLAAVEAERERAKAERLKLDRRIHNQRTELAFWNWHMTEHLWQIFRSKGIMNIGDYQACVKPARERFWRAVSIRNRARVTEVK